MFPMTVTLHDQTQLNAVLAAMNLNEPKTTAANISATLDVPDSPAKAPAKETTAKKSAPKTQTESAPTQPIAEVAAAAAPESKQEATSAPETVAASPASYPDVVAAINKLAAAKGRNAAVEMLGEFGVTKGPDLKPEQYADFIVKATAATEA